MTGTEHRDATFSRHTRDVLELLAARLADRDEATEEEIAELRDVVNRWDANEATAIFIEQERTGAPERRAVELYRRRAAVPDDGDNRAERIAYWDGRIDEYALEHEITAYELDAARAEAEGLVPA